MPAVAPVTASVGSERFSIVMAPAADGVPLKLSASKSMHLRPGMLTRKFSWLQRAAPSAAEPAQRPAESGTASDADGEAAVRQSLGGLQEEAQPRSTEATPHNEPHSGTEPGRHGGAFRSILRFGRRSFHWGNSPKDGAKGGALAEPSAALTGGSSVARETGEGNVRQVAESESSQQPAAPDVSAAPVDVAEDRPALDPGEATSREDQVHADNAGGAEKQEAEARGEAGLDHQALTDASRRTTASEARMSLVIIEDGPGPEGPEIEPVHVLEEVAVPGADATAQPAAPVKPAHVRRRSLQRIPSGPGGSSGSFHARKLSIDDIGVGRVSSFQEEALPSDGSQGSVSSSSRHHRAASSSNPDGPSAETLDSNGAAFPAGSEIRAEASGQSERTTGGESLSGTVPSEAVARQGSWAGSEGERRLVKAMSGGMEHRGVAWMDDCIGVADGYAPGLDGGATALQRPGTLKQWKSMKGSRGRPRLFGSGENRFVLVCFVSFV